MCGIYAADIYCDDCIEKIKETLFVESERYAEFETREDWEYSLGYDDERSYDSDDYPKGCCGSDESDCPQHCGDCGEFLFNDLTSDGVDYVREAVNEDRAAGRFDSVACTEWASYYDYIDFDNWCDCVVCRNYALCDDSDLCDNCAELYD